MAFKELFKAKKVFLPVIFTFIFSFTFTILHSQSNDNCTVVIENRDYSFLSGYEYMITPPFKKRSRNSKNRLFYRNIAKLFKKKGVILVKKKFRFWDKKLKKNPGLCIYFEIRILRSDERLRVQMDFINIQTEKIFCTEYIEREEGEKLRQKSIIEQIKEDLDKFEYEFKSNYFVKKEYKKTKSTKQNTTKIQNYFDKKNISFSNLKPYEGVFVNTIRAALIGKNIISYKLAFILSYEKDPVTNKTILPEWIKLSDDDEDGIEDGFNVEAIKVIVLQSLNRVWQPGEIKGHLYVTGINEDTGMYNVEGIWMKDNKQESKIKGNIDPIKGRFYIKGEVYRKIK